METLLLPLALTFHLVPSLFYSLSPIFNWKRTLSLKQSPRFWQQKTIDSASFKMSNSTLAEIIERRKRQTDRQTVYWQWCCWSTHLTTGLKIIKMRKRKNELDKSGQKVKSGLRCSAKNAKQMAANWTVWASKDDQTTELCPMGCPCKWIFASVNFRLFSIAFRETRTQI